MQTVVRRAEDPDVPAITALYLEVADEIVAREPAFRHVPESAAVEARYASRIHEPERAVHVALVDATVVGFVDATLRRHADASWYHAPGTDVYVEELIVMSRYRRRGIARVLMSAVEVWAKGAGARMVILDTHVTNAAARAFYASMAYREFGVILVKSV
jgi:GNAT superfamily N-acetyltransferase